jgi:hypothetical protein
MLLNKKKIKTKNNKTVSENIWSRKSTRAAIRGVPN